MKTIEEIIHEASLEAMPKCSDAERADFEKNLYKILEEGKDPKEAMGLTPELLECVYGHAFRLFNSGNYEQAGALFAYLSLTDGTDPRYFMGLAASYHMQKKYREAIDAYMNAFYLSPTDPLPFYHMADCCIKLNEIFNAVYCLGVTIYQCGQQPQFAKIKERAELTQLALVTEHYEKDKG